MGTLYPVYLGGPSQQPGKLSMTCQGEPPTHQIVSPTSSNASKRLRLNSRSQKKPSCRPDPLALADVTDTKSKSNRIVIPPYMFDPNCGGGEQICRHLFDSGKFRFELV